MAMAQTLRDMAELGDGDRDVLETLVEGRANPKLLREETGYEKGDMNTILVRLGRQNYIRQVERGLYEITDDGLAELGIERHEIDTEAARRAVDDLEAALERGDQRAVEARIDDLRDLLDEN